MPVQKPTATKEPEFKEPTPDQENVTDVPTQTEAVNDLDPDGRPQGDFVFVRFPDGTVHAVSRDEVSASNAASSLPAAPAKRVKEEEFYIHLANGEIRRIKQSEIPPSAGTSHPNGFYIDDDHAHYVTGVYPVETPHITPDED